MFAWVTSVSEVGHVDKAVLLACSLRRVRTSMKLIVIAAGISKGSRDKLTDAFDFVVDLPPGENGSDHHEGLTKIRALSLLIFEKCVYLAPSTLVLHNCDSLFDIYDSFAWRSTNPDGVVDLSVFLLTPSRHIFKGLMKKVGVKNGGSWNADFENVVKSSRVTIERLDEAYNVPVSLKGAGLEVSMTGIIVNFVDIHPLDMGQGEISQLDGLQGIAKVAIQRCLEIGLEIGGESSLLLKWPTNINEPIAIVGMSFRLPGGNTPEHFWNLLIEGRHAIQRVPPHRWTKQHSMFYWNKEGKVEAGFLDCPVDEFDAKFFGISTKEATLLDPQQRLLHEVSWEALEDAGIDPLSVAGSQTGFFVGSWMYNYKEIAGKAAAVDFFRVYMGNSIGASSARLSHFFGCTGPSIPTESGCSSAIVAVDMAVKSLRNRDTSLALACGVNLLIHPYASSLLEGVLSSDYRCKTFDANANGFVRAEGVATLVLKRYSDAVKDGDKVWGLIRGSAITQEGLSRSLGTPTVHCESLAMSLALKNGGVDPKHVDYIETHGTGTPVGDPLEVAAINKAYYTPNRSSPLIIGSVKTNVGHTESVSGITGIIKVLLAMKNDTIPPHLNLSEINPDLQLDVLPLQIPLKPVPWVNHSGKPRLAGVSSFGITGTDGHAIIQEPPPPETPKVVAESVVAGRPLHILKISAKSQQSFQELLAKYHNLLELPENQDNFPDIAYSANTGRATFHHRAVVIAQDAPEAAKILKEKTFKSGEFQATGGSLCFLFTGQGSQYSGMAQELYSTSPLFQMHFDSCDRILTKTYGVSIRAVLWGGKGGGNNNHLAQTLYSQTSIFCVEYCLLKLWESWGVKPDYVLGHSLGEFCAAVAAGGLSFEDALMLVAERSKLIDNLPGGSMLVIKGNRRVTERTVAAFQDTCPTFWVDYAALNSPDQTILAGDTQMISEFAKFCEGKSLKTVVLAASHAFHSRQMDPMLEAYRTICSKITVPTREERSFPKYISGMDGKLIDIQHIDADYWVRHTREKVSFMDACKVVQSEGCTLYLEVGPHPVLSALTMMNTEGSISCLPSLRRTEADWTTLIESLGKLYLSSWKGTVNWKGFDLCYPRRRVSLPFYPFNRKPIWVHIQPDAPTIHPLLGKPLPTAASTQSIFQNEMTIRGVSFSQDHVFGNTVVFPGAAFLEMCLAAGYASVQGMYEEISKPRRAVGVQNLKILTPLALYESPASLIQTISKVESTDVETGYEVSISRHVEGTGAGQWITHAMANFLPVVPTQDWVTSVDIPKFQENESVDFRDFYEKLPELGLRFGPKFQSLEAAWKSEKAALLALKVPEDVDSYLVHPVIIDAMLQTAIFWNAGGRQTGVRKKLMVPLSIGEFVYLESSSTSKRFVYCWSGQDGKVVCVLLDEGGKPLAYMRGIEFVETTLKMLESMIKQQSAVMPKLWEEIWKTSVGPCQARLALGGEPVLTEDNPLLQELARYNQVSDEEKTYHLDISNATRLFVAQALYKCGWKPQLGLEFTAEEVIRSLGLLPFYSNYVRFFLRSLASTGGLEMQEGKPGTHNNVFWFTKLKSLSEVEAELQEIHSKGYGSRVIFRFVTKLGKVLEKLFRGEVTPLPILFPEDPGTLGVTDVYTALTERTLGMGLELNDRATLPVIQRAIQASRELGVKPVIRLLEIGSGTGVYSRRIVTFMEKFDVPFELYYTDISAAFFGPAEKGFENLKGKGQIIFKKFNMDEDPLEQGFCPEYFDMLFACEVLHVSKDIKKCLKRLRMLTKPGGYLQIIETIKKDPTITFIFGLLDGYWGFEDFELRPYHATLSPSKWRQVLEETGFGHVVCAPTYMGTNGTIVSMASYNEGGHKMEGMGEEKHSWIVFGEGHDSELTKMVREKLSRVGRKVFNVSKSELGDGSEESTKRGMKSLLEAASHGGRQVEGVIYAWGWRNTEDRHQGTVSLPFFTLCQLLAETEKGPKVVAVTEGVYQADEVVTNPSAGTLVGMIRAINNECLGLNVNHFDLCPDDSPELQANELFSNLWGSKNEQFAFRGGSRLSYKLASFKLPNEYLSLPNGCERWQLALPPSRQISDLEFTFLPEYTLDGDEIEVEVKATSLNFRDVFTVLKPIAEFETYHALGVDFAGVVTKVGPSVRERRVGDEVFGTRKERGTPFPSHVKIRETLALPFPPWMTFAEASTIGLVFLTTYYSLVVKAGVKKGDKVLVHTASGGVGLCAIQVAKQVGAKIFATAGNKRKRTALRRLGVEHVYNSRSPDFGRAVMEDTAGTGVNIVLNTLTGPGFKEASLDALAPNGHFIELSILNIWSPQEVRGLRPDVAYHLVDLSKMEVSEFQELKEGGFLKYLGGGNVNPIPYERFDALNIRGALNYLQKAKHIGKIVCVVPEVKLGRKKYLHSTPMFNERSTYLVSGGLGGIGFEVVKWILGSGGKHVAIASRSAPQGEIAKQIESWNKSGKHVEAFQVDVGKMAECQEMFKKIQSPESGFPSIRGVMHAAGVLSDGIIQNQSWDKLEFTYNPKVYGTWNLHELTKDLLLEHFVLFSSMSATFGTPGQVNHSASNAFEDALAAYRHSVGLPATSINWGNWGEVGVATEIDFPGVHPLATSQGILTLEMFLRTQRRHGAVCNIDSCALLSKMFPRMKTIMDDKRLFGDQSCVNLIVNTDEFWAEVDKAEGRREGMVEVFKKYVKITLRNILKSDPDEVIDDHAEFSSIGVDSLMMLEMKNGMQNVLGSRMTLTASQLKDCNTVHLLANRLVGILLGEDEPDVTLPTFEELKVLVREDSQLPDGIRPEGSSAKNVSQVESVLLTGATGTLGPYLLRELCRRNHISRVYCLIRKCKEGGSQKLKARLEKTALLDGIDMSKVRCVEGDISEHRLGLSDDDYCKLGEEVDAVIHSAVKADHIAKYWNSPDSSKSNIRTVNVVGTRRILEFAVESKPKHVYHASSVLSVASVDEEGCLLGSWQDVGAFDDVAANSGYLLTKHISEQLVKEGVLRGIPCKVFRLPLIGGDSTTGRCDFKSNHYYLRCLAIMKLGCMPDIPMPLTSIPVDTCARYSLDVFFNPAAPSDVYSMIHLSPDLDQALISIAQEEFGITVSPVSYQEFVDKFKGEDDSSPLAPFKRVYTDEDTTRNAESPSAMCYQKYLENPENFFKNTSKRMREFVPDFAEIEPSHVVVRRDLQFLKGEGVFKLLGIHC